MTTATLYVDRPGPQGQDVEVRVTIQGSHPFDLSALDPQGEEVPLSPDEIERARRAWLDALADHDDWLFDVERDRRAGW